MTSGSVYLESYNALGQKNPLQNKINARTHIFFRRRAEMQRNTCNHIEASMRPSRMSGSKGQAHTDGNMDKLAGFCSHNWIRASNAP